MPPRVLTSILCAALFGGYLSGQTRGAELRGEITQEGIASFSRYQIELYSQKGGGAAARAWPEPNGEFSITGLNEGLYRLRILDPSGIVLEDEPVNVSLSRTPVTFRLSATAERKNSGPAGTVSYHALTHVPLKDAVKQFRKFLSAATKNNGNGPVETLQKAVDLDPEFEDARYTLGALYFAKGDDGHAVEQFETLTHQNPGSARGLTALAAAFARMKRWQDAEKAARQAVNADHSQRQARYLLGVSLLGQHHIDPETMGCLKTSEADFPSAHLAEAQAYAEQGNLDQAKAELRTYLAVGPEAQRPLAEHWLSRLTAATEPGQP